MQSWNLAGSPNVPRRLNVLILDGGGVRGVSSLLILQELMLQINKSVTSLKHPGDPCCIVSPQDIFGLVAGTSTGGLISLMLGKLGMDVTNCLQEYRNFSEAIFKRKQFLAIGGFTRSKYSRSKLADCVQRILKCRNFDETLRMTIGNRENEIACAVVCRECENERLKGTAVCICSLPCIDQVDCLVCEAARATSAAPTYFPAQKIGERSFVDGGLQFNNPSHAIYDHYSEPIHVAESIGAPGAETVSHVDLNFKEVRIINLGTGTKGEILRADQPSLLAKIVPGARKASFLKAALKEIAVDPENVVGFMRRLASIRGGTPNVTYERFSATNGVGNIKMDEYKELDNIAKLTLSYIEIPEIKAQLRRVGEEIARDYLDARGVVGRPASQDGQDQVSPGPKTPQIQPALSSAPETPSRCSTQPSNNTSVTRSSKSETPAGTSTSTSIEPSPNSSAMKDLFCG